MINKSETCNNITLKGSLSGFTLVELIVVVTILALLSTIGFVSYSSYLSGVRDTNRLSQLVAISDGLELYRTKKTLPIPDDNIEIRANGTVIGYQGYAGINVLETIDYSKTGKDPKDKTYFSYYLTQDKKHYQLLTYLEEEENLETNLNINLLNQVKADTDYTNRYPKVSGKKLGILTQSGTNIPVQEVTSLVSSGYLDIAITTENYVAQLTDDISYSGTGANLVGSLPNASCNRIKQMGLSIGDGEYTINPTGTEEIDTYCDMITNGGGRTRTHLLLFDALPPGNTELGYMGLFKTNKDYGDNGYTTDINGIGFNEFIYITDDQKENIEFINGKSIYITAGYKDEGFGEWIDIYTLGATPMIARDIWYYYTDINFRNKETIDVGNNPSSSPTGYRNMVNERLLSGDNGAGGSRQGTSMPFGKQGFTAGWCVGGEFTCQTVTNGFQWNNRASLWIR